MGWNDIYYRYKVLNHIFELYFWYIYIDIDSKFFVLVSFFIFENPDRYIGMHIVDYKVHMLMQYVRTVSMGYRLKDVSWNVSNVSVLTNMKRV